MDSDRIGQTATDSLFNAVTKYANGVPVIVVATKQDKFRYIKEGEARDELSESIQDPNELNKIASAQAEEKIVVRLNTIQKEMRELGRFDACISVAKSRFICCGGIPTQLTWIQTIKHRSNNSPASRSTM